MARFRSMLPRLLPGLKPRTEAPGLVPLLDAVGEPGGHERAISTLLRGEMAFAGDTPVFDRPLVLVAFTNRSGSNLACDYLHQTGRIGGAGEYLNEDVVRRRVAASPVASLPAYIADLDRTLAAPARALSLKTSWDQLAMLLRHGIARMFPDVVVVHCLRADVVGQAVSYGIALRTGRWTSRHAPSETAGPAMTAPGLLRQIDAFHRANLLIRLLCAAHGLRRHEIVYEALCRDGGAGLAQVLRAEGLADDGWLPGPPVLDRQAGPQNDRIVAQVLTRIRAAVATPAR